MKFIRYFKRPNGILILLGVLSIISLTPLLSVIAAPFVLILGKFGVLLALGIYFLFLPTTSLFIIGLLARITYWLLKWLYKPVHWFYCILIALIILAIPPYLINLTFEAKVEQLIANDIDILEKPEAIDTLAIISNKHLFDGQCEQICQRLLRNKQVKKIIFARVDLPIDEIDTSLVGNSYWMEKRDKCPEVALVEYNDPYRTYKIDRNLEKTTVANLLRMAATLGNCLVSSTQKIATADIVIADGEILRSVRLREVGLNPLSKMIGASRSSIYATVSDKFELKYQSTKVNVAKHIPILTPIPILDIKNGVYTGYFRKPDIIGIKYKSFPLFLSHKLGLKVGIDGKNIHKVIEKTIHSILDKNTQLDKVDINFVKNYVREINYKKKISRKNALLILQIIKDKRILTSGGSIIALKAIIEHHQDLENQFLNAMVERLEKFKPDQTIINIYRRYDELKNIVLTIPYNEKNARLISYEILEKLAHDKEAREFGVQAFKFLADYGEKGTELSLYLIGDKGPESLTKYVSHSRHFLISEALRNICKIKRSESQNQKIIKQLYDWLDADQTPELKKFWHSTISTLITLGAKPDELWSHMQSENEKNTRKSFDRFVKRAPESKCYFL